jgi:hypothetical protein
MCYAARIMQVASNDYSANLHFGVSAARLPRFRWVSAKPIVVPLGFGLFAQFAMTIAHAAALRFA